MIKTILVPATGNPTDTAVFETARALARSFGAHVEALHVRVDAAELIAAAMSGDMAGSMVPAEVAEQWERDAEERERRAHTLARQFFDAGDGAAASFAWHRQLGQGSDWIAGYGRTADLVVAGRPAEPAGPERETLEAALLNSGRPLLIASAHPPRMPAATVAIAWKPAREAARAVAAAAPFLAQARRIVVLNVAEGEKTDHLSAARLVANLRRHGHEVGIESGLAAGGSVADGLFAAAGAAGADLLVMGGYGHSRVREFIFGGVTEQVLGGAPMPVLMSH